MNGGRKNFDFVHWENFLEAFNADVRMCKMVVENWVKDEESSLNETVNAKKLHREMRMKLRLTASDERKTNDLINNRTTTTTTTPRKRENRKLIHVKLS